MKSKNNLLKVLIALVFLVLITGVLISKSNSVFSRVQNNYSGQWEWIKNDDTSTFNLELNELNTFVTGTHCISALNGNKSDCVGIIDEDEISIKGSITNNVLKVTFKGSFADGEGQAEIRFISADKIEWKVTKKIAGENYFPQQATLVKRP
ncbi:hypothetical protein OB69_04750 [Roseivirga seohaensis subsp. aquiponti]|uniref:Lipocalin-like domain-containing protein n=1 Tax=Roseivirga seohaensis subsp. aquiponti TaxID=1566026 RepID=A0A0L8ANR5_9BACT|nr:hypothetical protein [Roseivirga seohaensis]KOF03865.1 hypothetical protein OB69_04750 [Roseivirga seohaensis subsp. aquiponti]